MGDDDAMVRRTTAASVATGSEASEVLDSVDRMIQGTVAELGRLLDTKQVIGEPLTLGNSTVIPLVSVGFAFGAGGGGGGQEAKGDHGGGGGGGGGGGIKPVGVIIVDADGVRLARIPDKPSGLDRLGNVIANAVEKRRGRGEDED